MPAVHADLCIEARWIVPMSVRGAVLEQHAVVVRDGRILEVLPAGLAAERYACTVLIRRPAHLLIPGMVNADTHAATSLFRGLAARVTPPDERTVGAEFARDGILAAIAEMLRSGITCFADRGYFPHEAARAAADQGMRIVIGMPVTETPGPSKSAADYLTDGLNVRDEYRGHPSISTVFAPHRASALSDAALARTAALADELDAGIVLDLHESPADIEDSIARHGVRPIGRLWNLGLLTPALRAVHMVHATAPDIDLARRCGISLTVCPQSNLRRGFGLPAIGALAASGMRLSAGSGAAQTKDLWGEMKLLALTSQSAGDSQGAWDSLAIATCGGTAALGLEADVGTLEPGKWADLCCVDVGGPATQPMGDPVTQLVFGGGRDNVSDVWVAGRQLLSGGEFTRLDWPAVAARANDRAARYNLG